MPIYREIRITTVKTGTMSYYYQSTFMRIADHCEVMCTSKWDNGYVAQVVGYEGDVDYAEFLWTAALMMFSSRINPAWDDSLAEAENVYRMRSAGIRRRIIADRAWGTGDQAAARSRVQRMYLAECRKRGEQPMASGLSHQADVYQETYAASFRDTLYRRLRAARDAADTSGGVVALHGRADRVAEAFYGRFPNLRPTTPADDTPSTPCPNCARAKSGHCRQHPAHSITKADRARYERWVNSPSARAGRMSGAAAAEGVLITRGQPTTNRLEPGSTSIES